MNQSNQITSEYRRRGGRQMERRVSTMLQPEDGYVRIEIGDSIMSESRSVIL